MSVCVREIESVIFTRTILFLCIKIHFIFKHLATITPKLFLHLQTDARDYSIPTSKMLHEDKPVKLKNRSQYKINKNSDIPPLEYIIHLSYLQRSIRCTLAWFSKKTFGTQCCWLFGRSRWWM